MPGGIGAAGGRRQRQRRRNRVQMSAERPEGRHLSMYHLSMSGIRGPKIAPPTATSGHRPWGSLRVHTSRRLGVHRRRLRCWGRCPERLMYILKPSRPASVQQARRGRTARCIGRERTARCIGRGRTMRGWARAGTRRRGHLSAGKRRARQGAHQPRALPLRLRARRVERAVVGGASRHRCGESKRPLKDTAACASTDHLSRHSGGYGREGRREAQRSDQGLFLVLSWNFLVLSWRLAWLSRHLAVRSRV